MKVITIIQPWATLIALCEKQYETRSWHTKYRGELAIHAGKKVDKPICREEPYRSVLAKHGYTADNLPIGAMLARCRLADCFKVVAQTNTSAMLETGTVVSGNEFLFGDYTVDRYAWEVTDIKLLDKPIPAKGQLGLWQYPF